MTQILYVGAGGFVGAVSRFLLVGLVQGVAGARFPFGTLLVNVAGCVAIGGVSAALEQRPVLTAEFRAFLVIGVLGGFTTFSAFGNETANLLRYAGFGPAAANVVANVGLCLGGVWAGRAAAGLLGWEF